MRPQNPYDPAGWTGRVEIVVVPTITIAVTGWVRVLHPDPYRLWFIITSITASQLSVWPVALTSASLGLGPSSGTNAILVHNASYPSLVQGDWYARINTPPTPVDIVLGRAIA